MHQQLSEPVIHRRAACRGPREPLSSLGRAAKEHGLRAFGQISVRDGQLELSRGCREFRRPLGEDPSELFFKVDR